MGLQQLALLPELHVHWRGWETTGKQRRPPRDTRKATDTTEFPRTEPTIDTRSALLSVGA